MRNSLYTNKYQSGGTTAGRYDGQEYYTNKAGTRYLAVKTKDKNKDGSPVIRVLNRDTKEYEDYNAEDWAAFKLAGGESDSKELMRETSSYVANLVSAPADYEPGAFKESGTTQTPTTPVNSTRPISLGFTDTEHGRVEVLQMLDGKIVQVLKPIILSNQIKPDSYEIIDQDGQMSMLTPEEYESTYAHDAVSDQGQSVPSTQKSPTPTITPAGNNVLTPNTITKPFVTPVRDMEGNTLEYNVQDPDGSSRRISIPDFVKLQDFELNTKDIQEAAPVKTVTPSTEINAHDVIDTQGHTVVDLEANPHLDPTLPVNQTTTEPMSNWRPTKPMNIVSPTQTRTNPFESITNWQNQSVEPTHSLEPGQENFLTKGYNMIKDDLARKKGIHDRNRDATWGDEAQRIQELNALGNDKRGMLNALRKEGNMQARIPNLETRNKNIDAKQAFVKARTSVRTPFVQERELQQQGIDASNALERTSEMKGHWNRKNQRSDSNMGERAAINTFQAEVQPHIELKKSNELGDKLELQARDFRDKMEQKKLNFAGRYNRSTERFQDRQLDKMNRQHDQKYGKTGQIPTRKQLANQQADLFPEATIIQPGVDRLNYPDRVVPTNNAFDPRFEVEDFKQTGGYAQFGLNVPAPNFNKYKTFDLNNPTMVDYAGDFGKKYDISKSNDPRTYTGSLGRDYDEATNRTVAGQLNNINQGRATSFGDMNGTNNYVSPAKKNFNLNVNLGGHDGEYDLQYAGNRLQHQGNMIPAMWNMSKYVIDKPEKEPFVAPSMMYTQKTVTPDVLPMLRNKQQSMDMIRHNSRNTGDIMANIQQLNANSNKQESELANKVQLANLGEKGKFEVAQQDYQDKYQQEILRKNATDRANRLAWENLGSDAMTEYQQALINKGKMLNVERNDKISVENYLNQLTNDYQSVPDGKGGFNVVYIDENGKKVTKPMSQLLEEAKAKSAAENTTLAPERGQAITPVTGNASFSANKRKGGMLKRRNSLY